MLCLVWFYTPPRRRPPRHPGVVVGVGELGVGVGVGVGVGWSKKYVLEQPKKGLLKN